MRGLLGILLLVLITCTAYGAPTPFAPHIEDRFNVIEDANGITEGEFLPKVRAGLMTERIAMFTWDYTLEPGSAGPTATEYSTGVSIPADSLVIEAMYRIPSTIVSASDNTIAVKCESANDIISAIDMTDTATSVVIMGAAVSATVAGSSLTGAFYSNGCELVLTIGTGSSTITAGSLDVFIKYLKTSD